MSDKAPIFTNRSLVLITKVVAIYCVFHVITVVFKTYTDHISNHAIMTEQYVIPMYLTTALHLLIGIILFTTILKKRYSWLLTLTAVSLVVAVRIWFEDLALLFNAL